MTRLADTTVAELQRELGSIEDNMPTLRLVAAIAYKQGVTQSELADWLDVERKTIYNWFTRIEEQDLSTAVRNDQPPGRPRKLSAVQREELESNLQERPIESGVAAPYWTTELVKEFIEDRYDVDYSASSCRRLMKAAGLAPGSPRETSDMTTADAAENWKKRPQIGAAWLPT